MMPARFITLEGIEGAGKTTVADRITQIAARARPHGPRDAGAGRHEGRRAYPRAGARSRRGTHQRDARNAAHVRRAPGARRQSHPAGADARRMGALRSVHRRDSRLPGRRARRRSPAHRTARAVPCMAISFLTAPSCSTCRCASGSNACRRDAARSIASKSNPRSSSTASAPVSGTRARRASKIPDHRRDREARRRVRHAIAALEECLKLEARQSMSLT